MESPEARAEHQQRRADLARGLAIKLSAMAVILVLGYAGWSAGLYSKPLGVAASVLVLAAAVAFTNGRFSGSEWSVAWLVAFGLVGGVWGVENKAMPLAHKWMWTAAYLVLPLAAYGVGRLIRRRAGQ